MRLNSYFIVFFLFVTHAFSSETVLGFFYNIEHLPKFLSSNNKNKVIIIPSSIEEKVKSDNNFHSIKYYSVKDYWSSEAELKACEIYKANPYSHIVALGEFDILRAARIRQMLNLEGQKYNSALSYRDKFNFVSQLRTSNIPVPNSAKIESALDLIEFTQKQSFPIIVKPRRSAASMGITKIKNNEELSAFITAEKTFTDFHESHFIAQEFIDGDLYHVDGIVKDNKAYAWPSVYTIPNLEMLKGKALGTLLMSKENPLCTPLIELSHKILTALPLPTGNVFHIEIFHEKVQQKLYVLEAGCRPAGGYIMNDWLTGFNIDLVTEMMKHQSGHNSLENYNSINEGPKILCGSIRIPPKKGTILSIPTTCPLDFVKNYKINKKNGNTLNNADALDMSIADFYDITGTSEQEIKDKFSLIEEWFYENFKLN